jgi:hypothetical protein
LFSSYNILQKLFLNINFNYFFKYNLKYQTLVCGAEARLVRDCLFNHLCQSRPESESGGPSQTRTAAFQPGWCRGRLPQIGGPRTLGYHLNGSSQLRKPLRPRTTCGPARPARAFVAILAVRTRRLGGVVRAAYSSAREVRARLDCGPNADRVNFGRESDARQVRTRASRLRVE